MRFVFVLVLMAACTNPPPSRNGGAAPASGAEGASGSVTEPVAEAASATQAAAVSAPRVIFPDGFVVTVEIAADDDSRAQGLMYRDRLQPGAGMLFLFPQDDVLSFWMKNTRIPLDMIFIDASRRIVGIMHDVPPCRFDPCPSYGPNKIARYVLEVAGGVAREHGLKPGDMLRFEGTERFVVQ